uniref:Chromosome 12 open reading frame 50 n=1 Tax=Varanus komodoensis TaxID=61221 RepID=A0A8D2Q891_VARKO
LNLWQKYNSISCFWETQPLGCVRISCVFHHRKPRNINGLFLPPSSDSTSQREVQEGILHPAQKQDCARGQESTLRPIHPPLIITINLEDDDDEEQEEKYASYLLSKTPEDIEEEKAIKEMCYKSGEYYRIQTSQENCSTKNIPSMLENELLKPMETGRELQEGDGIAVLSKFNIIQRQTEITASLDSSSRSELTAFENGGGDCYLPQRNILVGGIQNKVFNGEKEFTMLKCSNVKGIWCSCFIYLKIVFLNLKLILSCCFSLATSHTENLKKHHSKGGKKKKWISEEAKPPATPLIAKGIWSNHFYKNAENASYVPSQRANGRSISLSSPATGRSPNLTYGKVGAVKESKLNLPTAQLNISACSKHIPTMKIMPGHLIFLTLTQ